MKYEHGFTPCRVIIIYLDNGQHHTFHLGLGPCGRTVERLEVNQDSCQLTIQQFCADNDFPDTFMYNQERIVRTGIYQTDNPNPAKEAIK